LGKITILQVPMFVGVASTLGFQWAFAEPLIFDCQGTYVSSTGSEANPIRVSRLVAIDPARGAVEAPGGGDNEHCTSGTDWSVADFGKIKLLSKIVKACTSLNISDTEYVFKTTREVVDKNLIKGQSEYEIRYEYSAWGSLDRINGKFDATEHFSSSDWTRWQMTCASPQGKSK